MATKRPGPDSSGAPPAKRSMLTLAPLDIGPAAGEEDLDLKVLKVQNSKLSERLREKNRHHGRLEQKIRQLEEDKDAHTRVMLSFKRHFGQLRDHLLALLVPLDRDSSDLDEVTAQLGDVMLNRIEDPETLDKVFETVNLCLTWVQPGGGGRGRRRGSSDDEEEGETMEGADIENKAHVSGRGAGEKAMLVLEELRERWRDSPHTDGQLRDKLVAMETKCEQLEEKLADARFDLQKSQSCVDHLEVRLADTLEELQKRPTLSTSSPNETSSSTTSGDKGQESLGGVAESVAAPNGGKEEKIAAEEMEQLQGELVECQALAESRLKEIKDLSLEVQELKKQVTQLQLDQKKLSDTAIADSAPYKTLQTQFSIAVQEGGQLRACLDEARQLLATAKQQHLMQLEEIRGEENKYQLEVREEMGQLENALLSAKRDCELLRIEFERTIASNEQAAPIAKELQVTVDSLQKTIQQLKSEVSRYKTRAHKAEQQLAKIQEEKEKASDGVKQTASSSGEASTGAGEKATPQRSQSHSEEGSEDKVQQQQQGEEPGGGATLDEVAKLKEQLAKMEEQNGSLGSQLETLKQATGKEEREKADILAAEKKARAQVEELKKRFEEYRKDYERRKDHIREESGRRMKSLTEDNKLLQKELNAKRHEAQALMAEMESTAQAFEEMQEQNIRLLQQLKEKDDANFKLMSERIKANSVQKLLLEEKDLLHGQLVALNTEKQRLAELIGQLEERERNSEAAVQTMDKELTLKQQAIEMHKNKALESVQSIQEWQLKVNDLESRIANAESALQSKVEECEKENMAVKRSQEEVGGLKRKLEKYKSREWMASSDEVLLEEIKTYKAKLNCPCCSTRKKDTVLTKCFHVFCSECIRSRYDSRLRKCPKCGAAFGANDFHKIYLS